MLDQSMVVPICTGHSPGSTKLGCDWDLELENPVLGLETPTFELEILILVNFGLKTYLKPGVLVLKPT